MGFNIHESFYYWQEQRLFVILVMEVVQSNKRTATSTSSQIWNLHIIQQCQRAHNFLQTTAVCRRA
jgi:hypothetical protein